MESNDFSREGGTVYVNPEGPTAPDAAEGQGEGEATSGTDFKSVPSANVMPDPDPASSSDKTRRKKS